MYVTAVTVGGLSRDQPIPREAIDDPDEAGTGDQSAARQFVERSPIPFPEGAQHSPLGFGEIKAGKDFAERWQYSFQGAIEHHR